MTVSPAVSVSGSFSRCHVKGVAQMSSAYPDDATAGMKPKVQCNEKRHEAVQELVDVVRRKVRTIRSEGEHLARRDSPIAAPRESGTLLLNPQP